MLHGTYSVSRVPEESVCRSSKDYRFTELGIYKIHSTSLMSEIPFGEETKLLKNINSSIFINDGETSLQFSSPIVCQNYITARYIGRAPLEWYGPKLKTKLGRKFVLICRGGNPNMEYRIFGTEDAIRGYNRNANENVILPGGGE